jgi:uncharacterized membrane protein YagU involved in acid resistance
MNTKTKAILVGGLIAGTCDILYATIYSWFKAAVPPTKILQSVASGLLGADAYNGGTPVAVLGLGLHFFMALVFAAVYVNAARSWRVLVEKPILCGATFGLLIYLFMNLVVLPLSRFPNQHFPSTLTLVTSIIVHTLLFGVPIALAARRAWIGNTAAGTAPA